ncbi:hypothetical protein ACNF49_14565 [Actinomadura sp. ATCC 39365]
MVANPDTMLVPKLMPAVLWPGAPVQGKPAGDKGDLDLLPIAERAPMQSGISVAGNDVDKSVEKPNSVTVEDHRHIGPVPEAALPNLVTRWELPPSPPRYLTGPSSGSRERP